MDQLKKLPSLRNEYFFQKLYLSHFWKAALILVVALFISFAITIYTKKRAVAEINHDFESICNDLVIKIEARLRAHALLLRCGAAFFAASDTVTREEWRKFNAREMINRNIPGIQGVGYAMIVPSGQLDKHIQAIRNSGFPNYRVYPEGIRKTYTPIIYLEPFSGRNIRAFGFDMHSEPVRRKAMAISCDSDIAMLSDKVILVQETNEDIQSGTLMYVPVYKNGMPINTIKERRAAIKGWVYSPYRMNDLMNNILGNWGLAHTNPIHLKIYDNEHIIRSSLLYDSHSKDSLKKKDIPNLNLQLPVVFNNKKWTLQFSMSNKNLSFFHGETWIVLITGITISFLLSALSFALFKSRHREKQIRYLNGQLEKYNADKNRFISILAHDLKSPFSALLGFTDLLKTNIHDFTIEKIESQIHIISNSANQIYNLLEDILLWATAESGKLPYEPENLNFSAICNEVTEYLKINAINKKIEIQLHCPPSLHVFADKNMLTTILRNLVSNAIKFTTEGGNINIVAEKNTRDVLISVNDNGVGIPAESLENLFNYLKINTTPGTAKETGTGLGLILCKEFIARHHGTIWAESIVGQGSTFKFTIPILEI